MSAKRVLISMPNQLLIQLDNRAEQLYKSRSELIRDAVQFFLKNGENFQSDKKSKKKETKNDSTHVTANPDAKPETVFPEPIRKYH